MLLIFHVMTKGMVVNMKRYNKLLLLVIIIAGIFLYAVASGNFNLSFFNTTVTEDVPETTRITDDTKEGQESDSEVAKDTENADAATGTQASPSPESTQNNTTASIDTSATVATPTPTAISPTSNTELPVYTVDANSGEISAVTAMVPTGDELTPEVIVDNVIESLADQSIVVKVKTVTTEGDTIIVNFDKDAPFYNNLGSGYEASILVAIAQSLIDNLPDINNIIYRIDDGPYVTGVYEYELDEVYLSR